MPVHARVISAIATSCHGLYKVLMISLARYLWYYQVRLLQTTIMSAARVINSREYIISSFRVATARRQETRATGMAFSFFSAAQAVRSYRYLFRKWNISRAERLSGPMSFIILLNSKRVSSNGRDRKNKHVNRRTDGRTPPIIL